jgi:F-type H+-transporting ATPase subunit b
VNITATLFGQIGTFLVLVWFVNKFLWGPMTTAMQDRTKRIADGLAAADRGQHTLELSEQKATEHLREAKQASADIIGQANKRADEIIDEAKQAAQAEGQRQLDAAVAEIEQESNRAKEQLREQVAALVMQGVEKILEREVNATTHGDFVTKLAQKL